MGRALMRCLRHAGPYDSDQLISTNHPKFGYGCSVPMSEAGWVNILDIIDKLWGGYTFKTIGELLSNLLLKPEGRKEKVRAQVAVLVLRSNGELVRHALVRAIRAQHPGCQPGQAVSGVARVDMRALRRHISPHHARESYRDLRERLLDARC